MTTKRTPARRGHHLRPGNSGPAHRRRHVVALLLAVTALASGCQLPELFLPAPNPATGCQAAGGVGTRTQPALPAGHRIAIAAPTDGAVIAPTTTTVPFVIDAQIDPNTETVIGEVNDSNGRRNRITLTARCYADNPAGTGNRFYLENQAAPARMTNGGAVGGYEARLTTKATNAFVEAAHVAAVRPAHVRTTAQSTIADALALRIDESGVNDHLVGVAESKLESAVASLQGAGATFMSGNGQPNLWIYEIGVDAVGTTLDFQGPSAGAPDGRIRLSTGIHDLHATIRWNPAPPFAHCHAWIALPDMQLTADLVPTLVPNGSGGNDTILRMANYSLAGFPGNPFDYMTGSGVCGTVLDLAEFVLGVTGIGGAITQLVQTGQTSWGGASFSITDKVQVNVSDLLGGTSGSTGSMGNQMGGTGPQAGVSLTKVAADDHGLRVTLGTTLPAPASFSNGTTPNIEQLLGTRTTSTGLPVDASVFLEPDVLNQALAGIAPSGVLATTSVLSTADGTSLTNNLVADPAVRPLYDPSEWTVEVQAGVAPFVSTHVTNGAVTDDAPRPSVGCADPALGACYQVMGFLNVPGATITVRNPARTEPIAVLRADITDIGFGITNTVGGMGFALELDKSNCANEFGALVYCSAVWGTRMHPDTRYLQPGSVAGAVVRILTRSVLESVQDEIGEVAVPYPAFDGVAFAALPQPGEIAGADRLAVVVDLFALDRPLVTSYDGQNPNNSHHPGTGYVIFERVPGTLDGFVSPPTFTWQVDTGGGTSFPGAERVQVVWWGQDIYHDGSLTARATLTASGTVMTAQGPLLASVSSIPRSHTMRWWATDPPCDAAAKSIPDDDPCWPVPF